MPCRACRDLHLHRLHFSVDNAVPNQPSQGHLPTARHSGRPARITVQANSLSLAQQHQHHPPGCICGGADSAFYSPIFNEPEIHSAFYSSHLSLREMILIGFCPVLFKMIKTTSTMHRPASPFPFAPSTTQQYAGRKHEYGIHWTDVEGFKCNGPQTVHRKHRELRDQLLLGNRQKSFFGVSDLSAITSRNIGGLEQRNNHFLDSTDSRRSCDPGLIHMAHSNFERAKQHFNPDTRQIMFCLNLSSFYSQFVLSCSRHTD